MLGRSNDNSRMEVSDRKDFHRLKDMVVPPQRELMTEQDLYDAGLSSITSLDIVQLVTFIFFCLFLNYTDFFILIAVMQSRV